MERRAHGERLLEAEADQADSRAADEVVVEVDLPAAEAALAVLVGARPGVVPAEGAASPVEAAEASLGAVAASQEDEANKVLGLKWLCIAQSMYSINALAFGVAEPRRCRKERRASDRLTRGLDANHGCIAVEDL